MIERHLRRVRPTASDREIRSAARRAFSSYVRYWFESFRLPRLSVPTVERGISIDGFQHVLDGVAAGNGVILALPHLGGWEWAGRWMTAQGYRLTVVVEQLANAELFEWFRSLRADLGMTVVPAGPDTAAVVSKALRANEVVCLLCDRDLQGGGIEVDFFGERTTLPGGPAMLSLRTGAVVLPVAVYFTDRYNGHHAVVHPPLPGRREGVSLREDVECLTQQLARELESLVSTAPEQWHLFQPNWPSDPGYGS